MRVKHYFGGRYYTIDCPPGTAVRHSEPHDLLVVPFGGQEISIPSDPAELLPMLAEAGRCGLALVGEPEPELSMRGAVCPGCGQDDIAWMTLAEDSQTVRCESCGTEFPIPEIAQTSAEPPINSSSTDSGARAK